MALYRVKTMAPRAARHRRCGNTTLLLSCQATQRLAEGLREGPSPPAHRCAVRCGGCRNCPSFTAATTATVPMMTPLTQAFPADAVTKIRADTATANRMTRTPCSDRLPTSVIKALSLYTNRDRYRHRGGGRE